MGSVCENHTHVKPTTNKGAINRCFELPLLRWMFVVVFQEVVSCSGSLCEVARGRFHDMNTTCVIINWHSCEQVLFYIVFVLFCESAAKKMFLTHYFCVGFPIGILRGSAR